MNALGQIVYLKNNKLQNGNNKLALDITNLAKGIYYLQIKTTTDIAIKRIDIN